jgi:hypothetical protein
MSDYDWSKFDGPPAQRHPNWVEGVDLWREYIRGDIRTRQRLLDDLVSARAVEPAVPLTDPERRTTTHEPAIADARGARSARETIPRGSRHPAPGGGPHRVRFEQKCGSPIHIRGRQGWDHRERRPLEEPQRTGGRMIRVPVAYSGGRHGVIVPFSRLSMFPSMHEYSMITVPQGSIGHVFEMVNGFV